MKSHKLIIIGVILVAVFVLSADARVVREDLSKYITYSSDAKVSDGIAERIISLTGDMELLDIFEHIESHPNDKFMISHLEAMVLLEEEVPLSKLIDRFRNVPSSGLLSVILQGLILEGESSVLEFFEENRDVFTDGRLLEGIYSEYLRSLLFNRDYFTFVEQFNAIFKANRGQHIPVAELEAQVSDLSIPGGFLKRIDSEIVRTYIHIKDIVSEQNVGSNRVGTSLRTIPLATTLERIRSNHYINSVLVDDSSSGIGENAIYYNGSYFNLVPWNLAFTMSTGRNQYSLSSIECNAGKGIEEADAIVSGYMEMVERYSAVAGADSNWPGCYRQNMQLIKAKASDLVN